MPTERLQKILSTSGIASRRETEKFISAGRVTVNGVRATLGDRADPDTDCIELDGQPLPERKSYVYLMLNKPRGYVTTLSDEKGRPNVSQLVQSCGVRVYPIGRLDMASEGLLLFTNDGSFANALMHPSGEVEKEYAVKVCGYRDGGTELLARQIVLDGKKISKPEVRILSINGNRAALRITIHEGRNRQIRRMAEAAGMRVTELRRIREGNLKLGDLPVGKWRFLRESEIAEISASL